MDCKELDRISRNGHSEIFENDIRSVFNDIDLGIDRPARFLHYTVYGNPIDDIQENRSNNFFRIPCKSRTVYCRKVYDYWNDKYEIIYESNLSVYGRTTDRKFVRSVTFDFPENHAIPEETVKELRRIISREIRPMIHALNLRSNSNA